MTNSYNNFKFPKILHKEFLSAELSLEANISWGRKTLWGKEKREMHEDDKKMARKKNQDENLWGRGMVHKPYNLYHRH